ncbi:MAG: glutathione S-transferase family protein [Kofleriaceae bacterium]
MPCRPLPRSAGNSQRPATRIGAARSSPSPAPAYAAIGAPGPSKRARATVLGSESPRPRHGSPGLPADVRARCRRRRGERADKEMARLGAILDAQLDRHAFVAADAITVADFSVASAFTYRTAAKFPIDAFPNVCAWLERMDRLEAWRQTAPPAR